MISTTTATQVFNAISPIVRKNITDLYIYRLRNQAGLESIIEEVSAVYYKKNVYQLYKMATEEAHGFSYIKLTARDKNDMFYSKLDRNLIPT